MDTDGGQVARSGKRHAFRVSVYDLEPGQGEPLASYYFTAPDDYTDRARDYLARGILFSWDWSATGTKSRIDRIDASEIPAGADVEDL